MRHFLTYSALAVLKSSTAELTRTDGGGRGWDGGGLGVLHASAACITFLVYIRADDEPLKLNFFSFSVHTIIVSFSFSVLFVFLVRKMFLC